MRKRGLILLLLGFSSQAYPEGSPWLPADGTTSLGISFISGSTEDYFIGDTSTNLGGDLEGTFVWLNASYGYDDIWAFDIRTGYAKSEFEFNPDDQRDIADTSLGVSYQFLNEFEEDNGLPTISTRIGYTFGGNYETNLIDAIGDGASGIDLSLLVGKTLNSKYAVFSDITYRQRDNDVADSIKLLLSGYYTSPIPELGFQLSLGRIRTDSSIDIGGPDFGVDQFSQTDKDSDWLITGVNYGLDNGLGLGFSYSFLLSGKNVADSDIATFNLSYAF
ncbi:MAG: hypothetical protein KTR32_19630 [Granulosicoccus sp.]|nr:hypothetical protein [Granulosicoccus sp.]